MSSQEDTPAGRTVPPQSHRQHEDWGRVVEELLPRDGNLGYRFRGVSRDVDRPKNCGRHRDCAPEAQRGWTSHRGLGAGHTDSSGRFVTQNSRSSGLRTTDRVS